MSNSFASSHRPLLILSSRPWNKSLATRLSSCLKRKVHCITSSSDLNLFAVEKINPKWIFVPHWSNFIPDEIWSNWPTVIFHMTDLPYGRGGSPLQNLIKRGDTSTMISALRCSAGLDTGDVYIKQQISLYGTAEEIFIRADAVIEKMIVQIVCNDPVASPQKGQPVLFQRRTPEQSNLQNCQKGHLNSWFDQIRMLDAEGYPHAFLEFNGMRIEFRRASLRFDGLCADVKIVPLPPEGE